MLACKDFVVRCNIFLGRWYPKGLTAAWYSKGLLPQPPQCQKKHRKMGQRFPDGNVPGDYSLCTR